MQDVKFRIAFGVDVESSGWKTNGEKIAHSFLIGVDSMIFKKNIYDFYICCSQTTNYCNDYIFENEYRYKTNQ